MYTLYTDKSGDFKCNINVEGADISNTFARLILENTNLNLMFEGIVESDGSCIIPIKKLKHILPEGLQGRLKLEVIADDTYFSPWQDDFIVKVNKRVTVEVKNDTRKQNIREQKINVQVTGIKNNKHIKPKLSHSQVMSEIFNKKGITLNNFSKHIESSRPLIETYIKKYHLNDTVDNMLNEIIINLK